MKNLICALCKEKPNIKINCLNYCNSCFLKQLENKVQRNLRKLPYKSKILIYFDGRLSSIILLHILNKLKNKKIYFFDIFTTKEIYSVDKEYDYINNDCEKYEINNDYEKIEFNDEYKKNEDYENELYIVIKDILFEDPDILDKLTKEIIYKRSDVLLINKTVEEICTSIFVKISTGCSIDESDVNDLRIHNKVYIINMYKDIKNKEIQYAGFLYKNLSKFETKIIKKTKTQISVENFIQEIDNNNSLALFNIINTVKKINKNKI